EDLCLVEDKANGVAGHDLRPRANLDYIKTYIKNDYVVERFAKEHEIHLSLVYSFYAWYQYELYNKNLHGFAKKFYPDYKGAVRKLNPITWDEENVREASEKIKAVFEIY